VVCPAANSELKPGDVADAGRVVEKRRTCYQGHRNR
jgi:hypothetical protein